MNLVFPVAGKGERFGGVFKPFLKIGDLTFIEKTLEGFGDLSKHKVFFICTDEQKYKYSLEDAFKEIFEDVDFTIISINRQTEGPFETLLKALEKNQIEGMTVVCDCDHYLNAKKVMSRLEEGNDDVVVPTYEISPEEFQNWSKVVWSNGELFKVVEKEFVNPSEFSFKGIVGCIGLKSFEKLRGAPEFKFMSEYIDHIRSTGGRISFAAAEDCLFYGDKEMYENTLNKIRGEATIFCDVDGVIIKHKPHSDCDFDSNEVLDGFDVLNQLQKSGHKIVLTTARNEKYRKKFVELLNKKKIIYDDLVMGCKPGHRILINDRKPSKPFQPQSISFEVERNSGIKTFNIDLLSEEFSSKILKTMDGNSFAKTYLVERDEKVFVRKHIFKGKENQIHCVKLKRQFQDLKRFYFLHASLVPEPIRESETNLDYFYDIEYLDGYCNLSLHEEKIQAEVLNKLCLDLNDNIYSLKKTIDGLVWIKKFIDTKISPKISEYKKIDDKFELLLSSDEVEINGSRYFGLSKMLNSLDLSRFKPKYISPIHGDLSFENILSDGKCAKVIDMDGSDLFDAPEQDLGKIAQSAFARYHMWNKMEQTVFDCKKSFNCIDEFFELPKENFESALNIWKNILCKDDVKSNAIFYMCCYFIRFVPFRMKISKEQGLFALIMSTVWMNKLMGDRP